MTPLSLLALALLQSPTSVAQPPAAPCQFAYGFNALGPNARVQTSVVFDDGNGPALYAAGYFTGIDDLTTSRIAKWDGSKWSPMGAGFDQQVIALGVFDDGQGPALYAGGFFQNSGTTPVPYIAKWNGAAWLPLATSLNNAVRALAVFNDGTGPALFVAGDFSQAGGVFVGGVAKWNGSSWSALGVNSGTGRQIHSLAVFDDGSGAALFVGGNFINIGGINANRIAKWNGTAWAPLAQGTNDLVAALAVFNDGSGPALFVGGEFTQAGGQARSRIAKWSGTSWTSLGSGVDSGRIWTFATWNDGSGPALYAGGNFSLTAPAGLARNIAKWNGAVWAPLVDGLNDEVNTLTVFNSGGNSSLLAGGFFTAAGNVGAQKMARWDGNGWSPFRTGSEDGLNDWVEALVVADLGEGPALFAGGYFTVAGDQQLLHIGKWNGSTWSSLGSGTNEAIIALASFDDGNGPALYA